MCILHILSINTLKCRWLFLFRFVSAAVAMATSPFGTCIINGKCKLFKGTPTVPAASIYHQMEPNCGQVCAYILTYFLSILPHKAVIRIYRLYFHVRLVALVQVCVHVFCWDFCVGRLSNGRLIGFIELGPV